MGIHEAHMAFGDWDIELTEDIPQEILDVLTSETSGFLGHMIITPTELDLREVDPLSVARYTGVMRSREFTEARRTIGGSGLVYWLGDQDKRGPINETVQNLNSVSFTAAVNAVLPPGITAGNIVAEIGTQSFSFLFATARYRLERICGAWEAEYDINPQGQLNAGTPASLYPTFNNPTTFIKRKGAGADPLWKHLPLASAALGADAVDFATRKLLVQSVDDIPRIAGEADQATSKRDLQGSLVAITDISGESSTEAANADARAAALLAQLSQTRNSVRLSTAEYDVDGTVKLGDSIYVWDPEAGLFDMANEVNYRGETYWPAKLRVLGLNWPLSLNADGSKPGVYFREPTMAGTLWNLTPYISWQNGGSTEVVVGALARSLVPESSEPLGPIVAPVVNPDTDPPPIPDAPDVAGNVLNVQVASDLGTGGADFTLPLDLDHLRVYISTTSGFTPGPTSFVGEIPANKGNIEAQASVLATFEVPTEATRYVRITAVDIAGNESPASTQVPVVATLIDTANISNLAVTDAKIQSASVSKLTAGDISAAIITITASGMFRFGRTTSPFHWGKIDANGIHTFVNGSSAYTGGTSQFDLDISAGTVTMTGGTIQTAASGQRVALSNAWTDQIRFYTGDPNEANFGQVGADVFGTGGTRRLISYMRSPLFSLGGLDWAALILHSATQDGSSAGQVDLAVRNAGAAVSQIFLTGTDARLTLNSVSNRVVINATEIYSSIGGTRRMEVKADRINMWEGINMNWDPVWLRDAGGVERLEYSSGAASVDLIGTQRAKLVSNNGTVLCKADASGAVESRDHTDSSYRAMLASAFTVSSDPETKEDATPIADPLARLRNMRESLAEYSHKPEFDPDRKPMRHRKMGLMADGADPMIQAWGYLRDPDGDPYPTRMVDLAAEQALVAAAVIELSDMVEALLPDTKKMPKIAKASPRTVPTVEALIGTEPSPSKRPERPAK